MLFQGLMQRKCHISEIRRQHSVYVQGLLLHAGVANFIRVSKGAWTMLIALFKVCTLLVTCTVAVCIHYMYTLHVFTTHIHEMYSLACWLSSAAADILLVYSQIITSLCSCLPA